MLIHSPTTRVKIPTDALRRNARGCSILVVSINTYSFVDLRIYMSVDAFFLHRYPGIDFYAPHFARLMDGIISILATYKLNYLDLDPLGGLARHILPPLSPSQPVIAEKKISCWGKEPSRSSLPSFLSL